MVGGVAVFALGGWGLYAFANRVIYGEGVDLDKAVAEAKSVGLPMTQAELESTSQISESDNAAPLIVQAVQSYEKVTGATRSGNKVRQLFLGSPAERSEATAALKAQSEALNFLRQASRKKGIAWDRDWDMGGALLFPEFAPLKDLTTMLGVSALQSAQEGDFNKAIEDLTACRRLAIMLYADNTLIGVLVGSAVDRITEDLVSRVMALALKNAGVLQRLDREVLALPMKADVENIFRYECYMVVATIRNLDAHGGLQAFTNSQFAPAPNVEKKPLMREGLPTKTLERAYLSRMLTFWTDAIRLLRAHPNDPSFVCKEMDARVRKAMEEKSISGRIVTIFTPAFMGFGDSVVRAEQFRGAYLGLCKALAYRAEHGKYPASLKEAGFTLKDPVGTDYIMKVRAGEILVYSVGPNKVDDGGLSPSDMKGPVSSYDGDVVALWPPRPPK